MKKTKWNWLMELNEWNLRWDYVNPWRFSWKLDLGRVFFCLIKSRISWRALIYMEFHLEIGIQLRSSIWRLMWSKNYVKLQEAINYLKLKSMGVQKAENSLNFASRIIRIDPNCSMKYTSAIYLQLKIEKIHQNWNFKV